VVGRQREPWHRDNEGKHLSGCRETTDREKGGKQVTFADDAGISDLSEKDTNMNKEVIKSLREKMFESAEGGK